MPSPTTSGVLVRSSLRLIGAIATGETPTADEMNDGISSLNDLLENLSTQNLAVYGAAVEVFPTVGGQAVYTIGPGGNWNTVRPVRIAGDAICTFSGVDFPVTQMGQGEYDAISLKAQQQPIVERLLYVNANPLGLITLWPVPSGIVNITLNTDRVLTQVTDAFTAMIFPPGYLLMMRYLLGILLAPDYGITIPTEILGIASKALADVKRTNKVMRRSTFDSALVGDWSSIGISLSASSSSPPAPTAAATPTFSPGAGTYSSAQSVAISSTTPGATIYYTTDGSTPTTSSTLYLGPVTVALSETLKAYVAIASGFTPSAVGSAAYVISIPAFNYVGVNGTPVSYFTPEFPFLDILKQGGNNFGYWATVVGAGSQTSTNEESYLQLDSNGYPTTLTALPGHVQTYDRIFTYVNRGSPSLTPGQLIYYPAGNYTFLFQGAGVVTFGGDVASTSTISPNVACVGNTITSTQAAGITATVTVTITTPSAGGFELYISQTDPGVVGNYLKAFSMVEAARQASYLAGNVFHPTFLTALSGFSLFRCMKWLAVENDDLNLTFTAQLNSGVTSGTLSLISYTGGNYGATWPFKTGTYNLVFQTGQVIPCLLTTGSSAVTWSISLSANVVTNQLGGAGIMAVFPKTQGWAGRKPFTALGWSGGVPYEVCLQLGNEANLDPWLNLPSAGYYTDTTMGTKLAQLAFNGTGTTMPGFTGLKPAQKLYVEHSNEEWNFVYNCTRFAYSMGAVYIPAQGNASFASQQWMGTQVGNIAAQFSAVYGGAFAARAVVSMGTQLAQLSTLLPQAMNAADWVAQGGGHLAPSTQGVGAYHSQPYCPSIFPIKNTDLLAINALADPVSALFGLLYSNTYGGVTYPSLQGNGLIGALSTYVAGQLAGISGQPWHTLPHLGYESGDGLSTGAPLNSGDGLVGVVITGIAGQFSCSAGKLLTVGDQIQIAGTFGGTGSITGYANPTTYQISVTNGTTTFTLQTLASAPIVTTAGTPTGLTYTCNLSAAQKTAIGTWLLTFVRDPRMALFFYDPASVLGGTGYMPAMYLLYKFLTHFQFVNPNDTNATWGTLENINQPVTPLLSAPAKYKGLQNFIAA